MNILIVGHGRMGRLVEQHAPTHGCTIAGIIDDEAGWAAFEQGQTDDAEVAIDFSTPEAVTGNLTRLAVRGVDLVIGTTGWNHDEAAFRRLVDESGIGVIAAANFALGMHVFRSIVERAARGFASMDDVGAWIHELHHAAKKDAPSGTALLLKAAMESGGYSRTIDVASSRAGSVPGTHEVGFDGPAETVTLTHRVRDRAVFAHGALQAAKWIRGRKGWFGLTDMLGQQR